jgi:hypothetical protein
MRCKVGDLVLCVGPSGETPRLGTGGFDSRGLIGTVVGPARLPMHDWSVLIPGRPAPTGDGTWAACDDELRPIRDNDGTDEMLRIAGLPHETPADVISAARVSA